MGALKIVLENEMCDFGEAEKPSSWHLNDRPALTGKPIFSYKKFTTSQIMKIPQVKLKIGVNEIK